MLISHQSVTNTTISFRTGRNISPPPRGRCPPARCSPRTRKRTHSRKAADNGGRVRASTTPSRSSTRRCGDLTTSLSYARNARLWQQPGRKRILKPGLPRNPYRHRPRVPVPRRLSPHQRTRRMGLRRCGGGSRSRRCTMSRMRMRRRATVMMIGRLRARRRSCGGM